MEIADAFTNWHHLVSALAFAMVRLQVAFAIVPLFNRQTVPGLARVGVGMSLSLLLVPPTFSALSNAPELAALDFVLILMKEAFLGLLIGYAVAVLFWGVEAVGFFIDNQRGASIASTLDPMTGNDSSPLGMLFNQAFVVYFLVAGGLGIFVTLLYASYGLWPIMQLLPGLPAEGITVFASLFARIVELAVLLSAPAIVAMMLAEMGLALVSRFAPQLQVFFLAMPVKCGMALFVLIVYLPVLFGNLREEIQRLPELLTQLRAAVG
ncbi:MAG: type III secretion system export apparatus subunit SctT [Gammaproteobacteria bacterium]